MQTQVTSLQTSGTAGFATVTANLTSLQAVVTGPLQALGAVSSGRHSAHQMEKTANTSLQAQVSVPSRPTAKRPARTTNNIAVPSAAVPEPVAHEDSLYVRQLRRLLVERLQLEEEYERLTMYLRDNRFEPNVLNMAPRTSCGQNFRERTY